MKILIVSPCFPPNNTPDLHRVRMMLPYLVRAGHEITVLAVHPELTEAPMDEWLSRSVPQEVKVVHVKAWKPQITRRVGLGNLGIRSFVYLLKAGSGIIRRWRPDVVFFSTTVFLTMPLGRIWKKRFGVPFVLDFQDPWRNDYYQSLPRRQRPRKYWFVHALNKFFERWTVPHADGIVAVNHTYVDTLHTRYGNRLKAQTLVMPMGAPRGDFDLVRQMDIPLPIDLKTGYVNIVYTGVVPDNMLFTIEAAIRAVKAFNQRGGKKLRLYFIGTNYGPETAHKLRVMPIAQQCEAQDFVVELPGRVSYFQAIKLMQAADILLLPGTLDPGYTASKFYVYVLAGKPVVTIFHKDSPMVKEASRTTNFPVVVFDGGSTVESIATEVFEILEIFTGGFKPVINHAEFDRYTDEAMASTFESFVSKIVNSQ